MTTIEETAPPLVETANRIVWCAVAIIESNGRPRTRIVPPIVVDENGGPSGSSPL